MKAVVQDKYGLPDEVLTLREIAKPVVGDGEVLVRVRAASMHPDVWHVVMGVPYVLRLMGNGVRKPKRRVPGTDLAGEVESVGKNVTRFKIGDDVFGECLFGWRNGGTFAEYAAVREDVLVLKPGNVSFAQAASVPTTGLITLGNLRPERIAPGHRVLINGAGGNVGSLAVQMAKARGARVTGVDTGSKLEFIRSLGADDAIDYTREDFLQRGERYDHILDVASTLSLRDCKRVLTPNGLYMLIGHDHFGKRSGAVLGSIPRMVGLMLRSSFDPHIPKPDFNIPSKRRSMESLSQLLESGTLTPIVAKTFPLGEVAAAMRYMQDGRAVGRIIITP